MDEPTLIRKQFELVGINAGTSYVVVKREKIIEHLKTLEGLKRNLLALLK